ncbi:hypothetical protein [Fluviicola sp.]|uniref:hypothetical protein n=1 Tax=Fluviicola sp. TaxID=1917219 RepID=UPI003D2970AA
MSLEDILYLFTLGLAAFSATILLYLFVRANSKLPEGWRTSPSFQLFKRSIFLLMGYLFIEFLGEFISLHLARNGIYNSYVMSINNTLSIPFLFGYFFINTPKLWKRSLYVVFYLIIVLYLISGGYYHPNCILPGIFAVIVYVSHFLAALIYLTDLLVDSRPDHFKFHIKISFSILIYMILASVVGSFVWFTKEDPQFDYKLVFDIHFTFLILFYLSMAITIIIEIIKLRRK